jgi:hypothetical protein
VVPSAAVVYLDPDLYGLVTWLADLFSRKLSRVTTTQDMLRTDRISHCSAGPAFSVQVLFTYLSSAARTEFWGGDTSLSEGELLVVVVAAVPATAD